MNTLAKLLESVPQPVYNAIFNWFYAIAKALLQGHSPADAVKKAEAQATSLAKIQEVYDARAQGKFAGFIPGPTDEKKNEK